jgi:hypothetical protein
VDVKSLPLKLGPNLSQMSKTKFPHSLAGDGNIILSAVARVDFYGSCEMPLTGSVPEGEKFFCPTCGALYSVTRTRGSSKKEADIAKCVVCSRVMDRSESTDVAVYTLIHRPEDA